VAIEVTEQLLSGVFRILSGVSMLLKSGNKVPVEFKKNGLARAKRVHLLPSCSKTLTKTISPTLYYDE
jgi:hypothetical protein